MLKRPEWNDGRVNLRALQAKRNQPFDDRGRELPFDDAKHLRLGRRRPLAEPIAYLHIGGVHPESLNYIMPYPLRQNVPQWGGPPGLRGFSRTRSAASHRLRPPLALFRNRLREYFFLRRAGGRGSHLHRLFLLRQTALQRFHDVDHRREVRLRRLHHLLPFLLRLDHRHQVVAISIVVFLRLEIRLQRLDQHVGHRQLVGLHQVRVGAEFVHLPDLVRIVHGVQQDALLPRPQDHDVLAIVHGDLRQRVIVRLPHRREQQSVGLLPAFVGRHVIRAFHVDGVHRVALHEFQNLHHLGGLGGDLLDVLLLDHHVMVLLVLVAFHQLAARHRLVLRGAIGDLLDARIVLGVQQIETHGLAARGAVQAHRQRNQSERQMSPPNGAGHNASPHMTVPKISCKWRRGKALWHWKSTSANASSKKLPSRLRKPKRAKQRPPARRRAFTCRATMPPAGNTIPAWRSAACWFRGPFPKALRSSRSPNSWPRKWKITRSNTANSRATFRPVITARAA